MATTRTRTQFATAVLRHLGLVDAQASAPAADVAYVNERYEAILAEMDDQSMAFWEDDAIPAVIYEPLLQFVGLSVGTAFGVPSLAENIEAARMAYMRRIRRHTQKKSNGTPVMVDQF
ncbi:MAG: hypothetical protein IPL32_18625 [Chloracidobacterium sp.]|nr:hypothetical protein [Chloracidobacterium sp.]